MELSLADRWFYFREYRLKRRPMWADHPPMSGALEAYATSDTVKRALDMGCGTGRNARFLAERGIEVVGVDLVGRAVRMARARSGSGARFVRAPATRVDQHVDGPFDLILDVFGPASDLPDSGRRRYAQALAHLASPGAHLLLFTFEPPSIIQDFTPHFRLDASKEDRWPHPAGRWHVLSRSKI